MIRWNYKETNKIHKNVSLIKLTHPIRKARTVIYEPRQNKKEKENSTYISEQIAEGQQTKQLSQIALSRVKRRELQIDQYKLH